MPFRMFDLSRHCLTAYQQLITLLPMDSASTIPGRAWIENVKKARRDLLLRAAREEFVEKGLDGATMRGVAVRAGCTTGAIYPLFDSKEAIYAALLEQSLSALDANVAAAIVGTNSAARRVEQASNAFLAYYLRNPLEVNLGLYAFRGLKRQGVGKDTDRALNGLLLNVLGRIAGPLAELKGVTLANVQPWVALLFSQMIGALVLHLAGRLDILDTTPRDLLLLILSQHETFKKPQAEPVCRPAQDRVSSKSRKIRK